MKKINEIADKSKMPKELFDKYMTIADQKIRDTLEKIVQTTLNEIISFIASIEVPLPREINPVSCLGLSLKLTDLENRLTEEDLSDEGYVGRLIGI